MKSPQSIDCLIAQTRESRITGPLAEVVHPARHADPDFKTAQVVVDLNLEAAGLATAGPEAGVKKPTLGATWSLVACSSPSIGSCSCQSPVCNPLPRHGVAYAGRSRTGFHSVCLRGKALHESSTRVERGCDAPPKASTMTACDRPWRKRPRVRRVQYL